MEKWKRFFVSHKLFFIFYGFILFYEAVVAGRCAPWSVGSTAYSMYALDYSFGFTDKLLPGALYGLFFKNISQKTVDLFSTVGILLFFAALSFLLERLCLSAREKNRPLYLLLCFFFLTGPATFAVFVVELGLIEVFWAYLAVVFFLVVRHQGLVFLSVPLCVIALLVNSNAIIAVVPMFCILLLYQLSLETEKKNKRIYLVAFILCVCVSLPFFGYLVGVSSKTLTYTYEEFSAILEKKGVSSQYSGYFFYGMEHIFDRKTNTQEEAEYFAQLVSAFNESTGIERLYRFLALSFLGIRLVRSGTKVVTYLLELVLLLPLVGLMILFFAGRILDKSEIRLRRFVFFCMPGLFVLDVVCGFLVSLDHGKWIAYAYIELFAIFLFVLSREGERVSAFLRSGLRRLPPAAPALYALIYAFTFFSFY